MSLKVSVCFLPFLFIGLQFTNRCSWNVLSCNAGLELFVARKPARSSVTVATGTSGARAAEGAPEAGSRAYCYTREIHKRDMYFRWSVAVGSLSVPLSFACVHACVRVCACVFLSQDVS